MGKPYSLGLRDRVVAAIADGMSTRQAAKRFSVSISAAGAWSRLKRATGSVHPAKQGKPKGSVDVKAKREAWAASREGLDADRLIFIDESGLSTKMARLRGWAPKGERCRAAIPHGHWKTITFAGGLTRSGFVAPLLLDTRLPLAWKDQLAEMS